MQVLRHPTSQRFLQAYWSLRQTMATRINPLVRERHDVDLAEVFLLYHIATTDLSPSEIADAMLIAPHTVSRRLDTLSRAGLVERSLDPDDARRRVLTLTACGQEKLQAALSTLDGEIMALLGSLPGEHLSAFLHQFESLTTPCEEDA